MRSKRLPSLGGNTNYSVGTRVGLPSKVLPPDFPNGKTPSAKYAAQWQNYIEYWLQQQIEVSAAAPFQNWTLIKGGAAPTFNSTSPSPGLAYNGAVGATLITNLNVNNTVYIVPNLYAAIIARTLAPAAGAFTPQDCAYDKITKAWWVIGVNTSAPTKTIWKLTGGTQTEITCPVSGVIERVTIDKTTGIAYVFVSDTLRTVLNYVGGVWSFHSTRGSSVSPAKSVAVNNGEILVSAGAGTSLEVYTGGSGAGSTGGTWTTRTDVALSGDTFKKVYYSKSQEQWYVLGDASGFSVLDTALPGHFVSTLWTDSDNVASLNSTLHGMGYANPGLLSNTQYISIAPDLPPLAQAYDNYQAHAAWTGTSLHYDGSAIYALFQVSGAQDLFRSGRCNAALAA